MVLNIGIYKFRSCGHKCDEVVNMMWRHFVSLYVKMVIDQKERRKKRREDGHIIKNGKKGFIVQSVGSNKCGNPGVRLSFPLPWLVLSTQCPSLGVCI